MLLTLRKTKKKPEKAITSHKSKMYYSKIVPKKVELLIRFFEPYLISGVFHFSLGTFEKVEAHPDPLGTSDKIYIQGEFDISGSNETMQNALASIV